MVANAPERRRLARAMVILGAAIATLVEKRTADTCDDRGSEMNLLAKSH